MKKIWLIAASCALIVGLLPSCTTQNIEREKFIAKKTRNLGEAYLREQKYTSALREFIKAEKLNPDDHFLQNDLGIVYSAKGRYDLAIQHFNKALEIKDDYSPARNNLGNAYTQKKQWDLALEQYKIVASDLLYATPYMPLTNIGIVYYQKKNYHLAEIYYLKALKLKPDYINALLGLAQTYIATDRLTEAIARLEKAARVAPASTPALFSLADAYRRQGDYQKAYNLYQRVVGLEPDSALAERALAEAGKIQHLVQQ